MRQPVYCSYLFRCRYLRHALSAVFAPEGSRTYYIFAFLLASPSAVVAGCYHTPPCLRRRLAVAVRSFTTALASGVQPSLLFAFTSALPRSSSNAQVAV